MIVFTYPGQGSQKPGMGAPWTDHPSWELVIEAAEASGRDLEALLVRADADELKQTRNAQMATYILSLVVLDAVSRVGADAAGHAGHSLGEYSALTAAGVIDFVDGVRLVGERGDAMQAAADEDPGTMAAVLGLDDGEVEIACHRTADDVWVANYNAPGQVVIAGTADAVQRAGEVAKELGAKRVMALPVGGAFHTPLMAAARDRLRKAIDGTEFRHPDGVVVANVDGAGHDVADDWPELLRAQLTSPVRWRQSLHTMADIGFTTFVELGPGTVLTGMTKRTISGARTLSVSSPDDIDHMLEVLHGPLPGPVGQLEGEHLFATERLVVSPSAGVFSPADGLAAGLSIETGDILGQVGQVDVRSPFTGQLMGLLALDGERVGPREPIAWLRLG
ncbi:MAG: ACP S-malonyltransferase [Acidimicrobiia bacterium]|nr:ACP S-malonyltransferase [Acidimicrobiia bacterium]